MVRQYIKRQIWRAVSLVSNASDCVLKMAGKNKSLTPALEQVGDLRVVPALFAKCLFSFVASSCLSPALGTISRTKS